MDRSIAFSSVRRAPISVLSSFSGISEFDEEIDNGRRSEATRGGSDQVLKHPLPCCRLPQNKKKTLISRFQSDCREASLPPKVDR